MALDLTRQGSAPRFLQLDYINAAGAGKPTDVPTSPGKKVARAWGGVWVPGHLESGPGCLLGGGEAESGRAGPGMCLQEDSSHVQSGEKSGRGTSLSGQKRTTNPAGGFLGGVPEPSGLQAAHLRINDNSDHGVGDTDRLLSGPSPALAPPVPSLSTNATTGV